MIAASLTPAPRTIATPMPSRPSMKSQSRNGEALAIAWNIPPKAPEALDRKPLVGLPPFIHARSEGVL